MRARGQGRRPGPGPASTAPVPSPHGGIPFNDAAAAFKSRWCLRRHFFRLWGLGCGLAWQQNSHLMRIVRPWTAQGPQLLHEPV